jgi:hypothetical protein
VFVVPCGITPVVLPPAYRRAQAKIGNVLQKMARKPPVFSRGMNGPSDLQALLKDVVVSTWTTRMKGTPFTC